MPSKLPILNFSRRAIRYPSKFNTFAIRRSFHPSNLPSQIQESNNPQSTTLRPTTTAALLEEAIGIASNDDMGRSGYDTTNMKVAKAPRPASSKKQQPEPRAADSSDKNKSEKQQQQEQPQGYPIYNIPQLCEQQQQQQQQQHGVMPMPSLEGRGWTFWL